MENKQPETSYQDLLLRRGMAHLVYHVSSAEDVIHPNSVKDYPLLSDEFIGFLENHRPLIPKKAPIVLEITGKALSEEDRTKIDTTIWIHNCLNMARADKDAKTCLKRCLMYLLFTLLSAILILNTDTTVHELWVNFAYLPFWFFGYRLLIYLVLDCVPMLEDRNWYRRLASLKLIVPEDGQSVFDRLDLKETASELKKYASMADREIGNNKFIEDYLMENGLPALACHVDGLRDIVPIPELRGREFLSDGLAAYLERVIPFIKPGTKVSLAIHGPAFTEEEQQSIRRAIGNHFLFRCAGENRERTTNRKKIFFFLSCILISSIILLVWGKRVSAAGHEFVLVLFWFFADYALDFILIGTRGIVRKKRLWNTLREMSITFVPDAAKEE